MNIDYVIMGHVSRGTLIDDLSNELLGQGIDLLTVVTDCETQGAWNMAREAWSMADITSEYTVVLQDDAQLCDDFKEKAEQFLTEHNGQVISFYWGDDNATRKYERPGYFDFMLSHAVCLAIPTHLIPEMIEYCDQCDAVEGDDMKMRRWLISKNMTCRYSNPSLVQHRDIPSIVNPEKPVRQSAIFQQ